MFSALPPTTNIAREGRQVRSVPSTSDIASWDDPDKKEARQLRRHRSDEKPVLKSAEHECPECEGTGFAPLTEPTRPGVSRIYPGAVQLAELGHPPNQNRPLIEKPGKMAGLINSINWTNAETTKLNLQWPWLRAGQRNPPATTKKAQTHCAACSKLLTSVAFWATRRFKTGFGRRLP